MDIKEAFAKTYAAYGDLLDPNGAKFSQRVFGAGLGVYVSRLERIGFAGAGRVLDAGCGYGQWALALAGLNQTVHAIDAGSERLIFLKELAKAAEIKNVTAKWATIEELPYENGYFDLVFCYSAIWTADWKKALAEYKRVLRPGGRVYLNANDIGWFFHLWKNNPYPTKNYDPRRVAALGFLSSVNYRDYGMPPVGSQVLISKEECLETMRELGFKNAQAAGEGMLGKPPREGEARSFFQETYDGLPGVFEAIAEA